MAGTQSRNHPHLCHLWSVEREAEQDRRPSALLASALSEAENSPHWDNFPSNPPPIPLGASPAAATSLPACLPPPPPFSSTSSWRYPWGMNTSPWGVHGDIWDIWMPATSSEHSGPRVRTRLRYQQRLRSIEWGLDALSYPNVLKRNAQRLEISVERLHGLVREYDAAAQQRAALEMELRDNVARFEMWDGDDEVGEQVGEQVWDPTDSEPIGEGEAIQQHLLIGWV